MYLCANHMRKKKQINEILEQLHIIDIASEGKCVAKADDMVVFVENVVPGDIADVQLYKKKKSFAEGRAIRIHKRSELRADPFCEHFGVCGGCKWQNLNYDAQLNFKRKQVTDAMERLAKVAHPGIQPILGSEQTRFYRNKLEYTFSNKKWLTELNTEQAEAGTENMNALGFHVPKRFDKIIDINWCHLQKEPSNAIRLAIRDYALEHELSFFDLRAQHGLLRNLIIRTSSTGELMVVVVFAEPDHDAIDQLMNFLSGKFPEITALLYIINQKKNDTIYDQEVITFKGRDHIFEQMTDPKGNVLRYRISPKSFYQTNSEQAENLYRITAEYAGLQGDELVYDLYTGTGTIANFVARSAKKVVGVEYVDAAIEDAKINSQLNGIDNTVFYAGDMKDILNDEFVAQNGRPDVIITDPPRAGMHEDVTRKLLELRARKIVYVSCNPATQARDLAILDEAYQVMNVQPVDMFPHTEHVENVVLLTLKEN